MTDGSTETAALAGETEQPTRSAVVAAWKTANAVVQARYASAGVDAFPVYSPEHGLDRFLLTRRVACVVHSSDTPEEWGVISLHGEHAPVYAKGDVTIPLGDADEATIARIIETLPEPEPFEGHERCWHRYAETYPTYYQAVTDLVVAYDDVSAARELFVDNQYIDGTYHPLYLHAVATEPKMVYDWFSIESSDYSVFVRINGEMTIHQTETGAWRAVGPALKDASVDEVKLNLRGWLRLQ